jgi:hypothetical protein
MKHLMVVIMLTVAALCQSTVTVTHEDGTRTTATCNNGGECVVYDPDSANQALKVHESQSKWCHNNHIKKGVACENAWQRGFRGKLPVCDPTKPIDLHVSCWETLKKGDSY